MADPPALRELLLPRGTRGRTVEVGLREAIRDGRLAAGTRLPSSRDLATQLGVARGTVTAAYAQLVAEGHLTAKRGSGTTVAAVPTHPDPTPPHPPPQRWRYDLRPGVPALSAFPRTEWQAATRAGLATLTDDELGYPDPAGLPALRTELAAYLGRVRSLRASDVVITHGVAESQALLAFLLREDGHHSIAVESPTHPGSASMFAAHGLTPIPIPVDGDGIDVTALSRTTTRAVLVTAAHQFPLGVVLGPTRRRALIDWATTNNAIVIEDDYDAEHRYDRPAIGPVHTLAHDRVAYLGSVSKVLAPALRLGWLIPPTSLRTRVVERKRHTDLGCSPLPQAALAHLLRTGGYDRHLRRTRALYRTRRDTLLTAITEHLPTWRSHGVAAGLHLVLRLPPPTNDTALEQAAARRGIHTPALSTYTLNNDPPPFPGLVVGYAATSPDRLRAAVRELATIPTSEYS